MESREATEANPVGEQPKGTHARDAGEGAGRSKGSQSGRGELAHLQIGCREHECRKIQLLRAGMRLARRRTPALARSREARGGRSCVGAGPVGNL